MNRLVQHTQTVSVPLSGADACDVETWIAPAHDRKLLTHVRESILSPEEIVRAAKFTHEEDRDRYLTARALLRTVLSDRVGVALGEPVYHIKAGHKPALVERFADSGWQFSWSHAGGAVLLALCRGRDVGADIEPLGSDDRLAEIESEFLSATDRAQASRGEASRGEASRGEAGARLQFWTRKEAALKAAGVGLNVPMHSFDGGSLDDPHAILDVSIADTTHRISVAAVPMPREFADYVAHVAIR